MNDDANKNNDDNYRVNYEKTAASKSFDYETNITGSTPINNNTLDTEVVVSLKYLSNFWRSLNLSLTNYETELDLPRLKDCKISEIFNTPEIDANPPAVLPNGHAPATSTTSALFQINSTKLYVPVVTLSINNSIKFLENRKHGFERKIYSNINCFEDLK